LEDEYKKYTRHDIYGHAHIDEIIMRVIHKKTIQKGKDKLAGVYISTETWGTSYKGYIWLVTINT
jgi:hypothetical protein